MRGMKKVTLAVSAAVLAVGGVAYAQMSDSKPKFDTDGDGVITRAEAQTAATTMFAKLDANKDGKLDKSDREAHRGEMLTKRFEMLDTNKDSSISRQEFMAAKGPDHDGMRGPGGPDKDGHGEHGKPGGPDGPGMEGHHRMHRAHRGGMMMMMMKTADADNDGAVSQAEFTAAANKRFDTADADKDGKITKEEHDAAHQKMKETWKIKKAQAPDSSN